MPVIGAVEPGAASALAATRNGHIGVIGTLGTIRSGAYATRDRRARRRTRSSTALACPLLVPLAEEGWIDDEVAELVARRYLDAAVRAGSRRSTRSCSAARTTRCCAT